VLESFVDVRVVGELDPDPVGSDGIAGEHGPHRGLLSSPADRRGSAGLYWSQRSAAFGLPAAASAAGLTVRLNSLSGDALPVCLNPVSSTRIQSPTFGC